MALTKVKADGLTADLIDETKLADNSIDSEHYNDGSIDTAHVADDAVTADKLANAINTDIAAKAVLTGSTNNTITTVTAANAIQGEANLTFDGTTLNITDTELSEASDNFTINIQSGNNDFYVKSGGTTIAAFKGLNKHLEISDGDLVIGTAGHGIDFSAQTGTSATGAATGSDSDDELLDHYENGTWTPVADGAGTINGTSITYTGRYARVGQIVTVWFAASNSAGDIEIPSYKVFSGLPFTTGGWRSVGRVCTEDAEVTARCGDISCTSGTSIIINNSGSSTGTVNIGGSLTYAIS